MRLFAISIAVTAIVLISTLASIVSTETADRLLANYQKQSMPATNFDLRCHCNEDSNFYHNDTRIRSDIKCENDSCYMPAANFSGSKMCLIEATITARPFKFRKICSQPVAGVPFYTDKHVFVARTLQSEVIVFHKCHTDYCNANFSTAGLPWLDEELKKTADHCVPNSTDLVTYMLQKRRNLEGNLTCGCSTTSTDHHYAVTAPCKDGQCTNAGITDEFEKKRMTCVRDIGGGSATCQRTELSELKAAENFTASYVFDKERPIHFFGCRDKDLCNVGLPEGMLSVEDMVCHWMCPKSKRPRSVAPKWWHYAIVCVILTIICCAGTFVGTIFFRITIRRGK